MFLYNIKTFSNLRAVQLQLYFELRLFWHVPWNIYMHSSLYHYHHASLLKSSIKEVVLSKAWTQAYNTHSPVQRLIYGSMS